MRCISLACSHSLLYSITNGVFPVNAALCMTISNLSAIQQSAISANSSICAALLSAAVQSSRYDTITRRKGEKATVWRLGWLE